jgi:membrane protein DedA with SNARE-associated domain
LAQFVSIYGVWLVAAFIALESVGIPLPAEASLIAAGFFAARNHNVSISLLIGASVLAALSGEFAGFWIGRKLGYRLLNKHGSRIGLTDGRLRIGRLLFARYGGRFVFAARFLPILRNMAAVLAGSSSMAQQDFYFASGSAAVAWIMCYGFGAYLFGETFTDLASPVAVLLGLAALLVVFAVPALVVRYETSLLAQTEH